MAGWGTYPWSTSPWAGAVGEFVEIVETVAVSESIEVVFPLEVASATALTPYLVEVFFSQNLDYGYAPILTTGNYSTVPALTISNVLYGGAPNSIRLVTNQQMDPLYTLTVVQAESLTGDPLDPAHRTAIFAGFGAAPTFFAAAQSRTKVQLVFSAEMEQNVEFLTPASYTVTDLNLNPIPVTSATAYGPTPVQRLTLELDSEMNPGGYYVVTIVNPNVKTTTGLNVVPTYDMFQWAEMQAPYRTTTPININISSFSGETSGGLLGQPLGQVFFSPALEAAIADSSIQIDSVSCCTRAYDVYTIPILPDPEPLMTWGPEQTFTTVLSGNVLWATADRLGLSTFTLSDFQQETMPQAVDGPADGVLQETYDQTRVSLLNVDDWGLYDGVVTPFKTADNLTPIPAGSTTNISLQP